MSFVVTAALLVGLLVGAPIFAHLLKRGKTKELDFPPTTLVPKTTSTSKKRSRLDDRWLLLLRALMILALAVLGATPLVKCSRLSVARTSGASVALAIVLDDSHSMRSLIDGETRWERAKTGAEELLVSTRHGDSVAIVLAGRPARVALSPTTDRDAAQQTLTALRVSDRATDLADAVKLARASLQDLPQVDKRVVLLSDLADAVVPPGVPPVFAPLPALAQPAANCGLTSCQQTGRVVAVEVACSDGDVARDREVSLSEVTEATAAPPGSKKDEPKPAAAASPTKDVPPVPSAAAEPSTAAASGARRTAVLAHGGAQSLRLQLPEGATARHVKLSGQDADASDDTCAVSRLVSAPRVAIVVDRALASTATGGPTVVEQALSALRSGVDLRPLTLAPESAEDLDGFMAIILDDPAGLSPEARASLTQWVDKGGIAVALLGPRAPTAQLAANLTPFVEGAVQWEPLDAPIGIETASLAWLGGAGSSLDKVTKQGRALFGSAIPAGARVRGRWQDEQPWLLERAMGQGLVLTLGLPASVDVSDLALRPAFLALFDYVYQQAESRSGPRRSVAGATWRFPVDSRVAITGPSGKLRPKAGARCAPGESGADCHSGHAFKYLEVGEAGTYEVTQDGATHDRTVDIEPAEILAAPAAMESASPGGSSWTQSSVDASPHLALVVLLLFAAELVFRTLSRKREPQGS